MWSWIILWSTQAVDRVHGNQGYLEKCWTLHDVVFWLHCDFLCDYKKENNILPPVTPAHRAKHLMLKSKESESLKSSSRFRVTFMHEYSRSSVKDTFAFIALWAKAPKEATPSPWKPRITNRGYFADVNSQIHFFTILTQRSTQSCATAFPDDHPWPLSPVAVCVPPQDLYRKDCNLAAQLLQCNKSLYRAQLSEVSLH